MSPKVQSLVRMIRRLTPTELVELRDALGRGWDDGGDLLGVREPRPRGPSPSLEAEAAQRRAWDNA